MNILCRPKKNIKKITKPSKPMTLQKKQKITTKKKK